jgi:FkbM family methyltransferase
MKPPPFSLVDMLGRGLETIRVADVGAMWIDAELPPYHAMAKSGAAQVIGFEAVKAECDKLNAKAMTNHRYLPYFIGDGSERVFHTCNKTMTSSLYEPNTPLLRRFQYLEELTRVVETAPVKTTRLDDVPEVEAIDYLKMDVQGAELDVLRGAERLLGSTLVIQAEVEFSPMYKDQPLFADVDAHLRARGFSFHCFLSVSGRTFRPLVNTRDIAAPFRQLLWGEAVYTRDYMRLRELEPPALLQMATILHEAYSSCDLAALCLQHHDAKTRGKLWPFYMQRLTKGVPEAPPLD